MFATKTKKALCLLLVMCLSSTMLVQTAAQPEKKIIYGVAVNDGAPASFALENIFALQELVHGITGKKEPFVDIETDPVKWLSVVAETTGLPIETNTVLIPLNITDPSDLDLESHSESWDSHGYSSSQLFDATTSSHTYVPRYWPYIWFVKLREGSTIDIPLNNRTVLARLTLATQKGLKDFPFHLHAAHVAGRFLAKHEQENETEKEIIKLQNNFNNLSDALMRLKDETCKEIIAGLCNDTADKINRLTTDRALQQIKARYDVEIEKKQG